MNRDQFKGQWKQFKGKAKTQWAKLTDDDLLAIEGDYEQLVGRVQEAYGKSREEAEKEVQQFTRDCGCD